MPGPGVVRSPSSLGGYKYPCKQAPPVSFPAHCPSKSKSLSEFTASGNTWISEMKADVAWAGVRDASAMSLPGHLDPVLPSLEPKTLLSTSTSQRLAWELEILIWEIKFKKIMSHCPFLSARMQKSD